MDKFNFLREGMMKLPPGFRFQPTDEELVFEYLKRKVLSWPLPASIIPEINVFKFDPWDLPGDDIEQERYFFSKKEAKYPNGNRINRATASGFWKATGVDRQIGSSSKNHATGMKKTLVFYRGKNPHASKTDWIMHEYRLVSVGTTACNNFPPTKNSSQNSSEQIEKWVLCRIFMKKRNSEINQACNKDERIENVAVMSHQPRFFDFLTREKIVFDSVSSSSSSSSSSIITEVSSNGEDLGEESSSTRNFF